MDKKNSISKNQIIGAIAMMLFLGIVFVFVYKAQLEDQFDKRNSCTLMWLHKTNNKVELSVEKDSLTQVFHCNVPYLKSLTIECKGKNIDPSSYIELSLSDPATGKQCYYKKSKLSSVVKTSKKKVKLNLSKSIADSEGKQYILNISLIDAGESQVQITANTKAGIVNSFDGSTDNKTNVIYGMQYSSTKHLKTLYVVICVFLTVAVMLSYYLIIIRKKPVEKFYIPVALFMGMIFQFVIVVHGVPDEPWHIDTAYKLSNKLMFVDDSEEPLTLMKRQCDIEMSDMLANGVESNSYYQLLRHTFERPENVQLVKTTYTDSSNLVPDVIFLPTAVGISIGRLLGASALLTYQLGRMCNLIVFVLLIWLAIRQTPYGKNVMAALGFVPIALQQGASASYDPVITGIVFLFIATCFRLLQDEKQKKRDIILALALTVLIALVKGGVYLPIIFLLVLVVKKRNQKRTRKPVKMCFIIAGIGIVCVVGFLMIQKLMPFITTMLMQEVDASDMDAFYSLPYILDHPLQVVYLYWNTFMKVGANHLTGMIGGKLGWHDIAISWIYIIAFLISILLLVNVEQDQYRGTVKQKTGMAAMCVVSILLIMMSMLIVCTTLGAEHIAGIQGRYYLPLASILFMLTSNSMIRVKKEQCNRIWMFMVLVQVMVVLQFVASVL